MSDSKAPAFGCVSSILGEYSAQALHQPGKTRAGVGARIADLSANCASGRAAWPARSAPQGCRPGSRRDPAVQSRRDVRALLRRGLRRGDARAGQLPSDERGDRLHTERLPGENGLHRDRACRQPRGRSARARPAAARHHARGGGERRGVRGPRGPHGADRDAFPYRYPPHPLHLGHDRKAQGRSHALACDHLGRDAAGHAVSRARRQGGHAAQRAAVQHRRDQ